LHLTTEWQLFLVPFTTNVPAGMGEAVVILRYFNGVGGAPDLGRRLG